MHILWITGSRIVGGAERVTFQVAGGLVRRGHRLSALYRPSAEFERLLHAEGIARYPAALGGSLNFFAWCAIRQALSRLRPDVAMVTTPDEWVWACLLPRASLPTQLVLVRHMALALPAKVKRLANARADAIVAVSEAARATLLRPPAIEPRRLHVLTNPVRWPIRDTPPSAAERAECRKLLGLPLEGKWLGFFGGGEPQKGIRDVLQALRRLEQTIGGCSLLVCGRPARDKQLPGVAQLAVEYGFDAARVRYLGQIENVEQAMTACDAVVIATHLSLGEGAPLIALEAMAAGLPVAGYALEGIGEVLGTDGQSGVLAKPDDPEDLAGQLRRLLDDNAFAQNLASAGLARARERFSPELAVSRYEALFSQLCASAARSG